MIEVLQSSDGLLRAQDLFNRVAQRTGQMASVVGVEQQPELKPIREAGHEAGSFFLVPQPGTSLDLSYVEPHAD